MEDLKTGLRDVDDSCRHEAAHAVFGVGHGLELHTCTVDPDHTTLLVERVKGYPLSYKQTRAACVAALGPVCTHYWLFGEGITGAGNDREAYRKHLEDHTGNEPEAMNRLAALFVAHAETFVEKYAPAVYSVATQPLKHAGKVDHETVLAILKVHRIKVLSAAGEVPDFRRGQMKT